MIKVSIVVPVYNARAHLDETLKSLTGQTLRDIEIICVDDASSDGSRGLIEAYAARDPRVKGIYFQTNASALQARKAGVLTASGRYILFVDADDTLDASACATLYKLMDTAAASGAPVDILQFNARISNVSGVSGARLASNAANIRPYDGRIDICTDSAVPCTDGADSDLTYACFSKRLFSFTLWGKLFDARLCARAFAQMEDIRLPKAQDLYISFVIFYNARSYMGLPELYLYTYNFGRGNSGLTAMNLGTFGLYCDMALTCAALERFIDAADARLSHGALMEPVRRQLFNDNLANWHLLRQSDMPAGYDMMLDAWGADTVIPRMAAAGWENPGLTARGLGDGSRHYAPPPGDDTTTGSHTPSPGDDTTTGSHASSPYAASAPQITPQAARAVCRARTVGTYFIHLSYGGTQKVLAELARLWREMGCDVVVFTDTGPTDGDCPLPPGVAHVKWPGIAESAAARYRTRYDAIRASAAEYNIDVMVYHLWISPVVLWDLLTIKSLGIPFIMHTHSVFSSLYELDSGLTGELTRIYRLIDHVVVLNRVDEMYWRNFCRRVTLTQNPPVFDVNCVRANGLAGHNVLWVGRLSPEKNPIDAIDIMNIVIKRVPDAVLHVVGGDDPPKLLGLMKQRAAEAGIADSVVFHGGQAEVGPYYANASVFLTTSAIEGYSLTLAESRCFGLPCVSYAMPYLKCTATGAGLLPCQTATRRRPRRPLRSC